MKGKMCGDAVIVEISSATIITDDTVVLEPFVQDVGPGVRYFRRTEPYQVPNWKDYIGFEEITMAELTGWASDYYELPKEAKQLQDLIEYRDMNFAMATIFKACYRFGHKPGTTKLYDIEKILWFAERERQRLLNETE